MIIFIVSVIVRVIVSITLRVIVILRLSVIDHVRVSVSLRYSIAAFGVSVILRLTLRFRVKVSFINCYS